MRLGSVLLSIQSQIMNASPLKNEPGFEGETDPVRGQCSLILKKTNMCIFEFPQCLQTKLSAYNSAIQHETIRVAVIGNLARKDSMPPQLR
jgi:hypothetical protein